MMNKKTTDIVAYLTWVGLLVAFVAGDRREARFHLNQSLVIWLAGTLAGVAERLLDWLPLVGWLVDLALGMFGLFCAVCWFIGIIDAIRGVEKPVPLLGGIHLLH